MNNNHHGKCKCYLFLNLIIIILFFIYIAKLNLLFKSAKFNSKRSKNMYLFFVLLNFSTKRPLILNILNSKYLNKKIAKNDFL